MKTRPRTLTRQIVVRVDDRLHERLVADAEANGRTVAQTVRHRLSSDPAPGLSESAYGRPVRLVNAWHDDDHNRVVLSFTLDGPEVLSFSLAELMVNSVRRRLVAGGPDVTP